jgi:hypothetical protein
VHLGNPEKFSPGVAGSQEELTSKTEKRKSSKFSSKKPKANY